MTDDERLTRAFGALGPTEEAVARVAGALGERFEAPPQSLLAEWVELLWIRPVVHGATVLAAAGVAAFASPVVSLALLLLRKGFGPDVG